MNIALADEFKLYETYLLSSQTINRKLPISCKNRSGKYGFQPLLIFFRLVIGKTLCILNDFDNKNSLLKFRSSYGSSIFKEGKHIKTFTTKYNIFFTPWPSVNIAL